MDAETRKYLEDLLSRPVDSLDETEQGFLNARRAYLTPEQRARYSFITSDTTGDADILPPNENKVEVPEEPQAPDLGSTDGAGQPNPPAAGQAQVMDHLETAISDHSADPDYNPNQTPATAPQPPQGQ
jgi:hypothetical protein